MSNNQMVSVPRELLERCKQFTFDIRSPQAIRSDIDVVLTKPAEQHQGEPVALPARTNDTEGCCEMLRGLGLYGDVNVWNAGKIWNACLDELAKLGPLYTRPAQGEPVAYLITPPGCSPALVFARDIRSVNAYTAPLFTRADPADVERLRRLVDSKECERLQHIEECAAEVNALRAQLAERGALLKRCEDSLFNLLCFGVPEDRTEADKLIDELRALSASAEPSAPVERDDATLTDALRTCEKWFVKHSPTAPLIGGFGDAEHPMLTCIRAALELKP